MNKRILIFSIAYHPYVGGAELAVRNITDRLPSPKALERGLLNYEFDLISAKFKWSDKPVERISNVNVYRVSFPGRFGRYLYPLFAARLAKKLHRANKYQLVWSIMAAYAGAAALLFLNRFSKVPFLLTLQEGDSIDHIHGKVKRFKSAWREIFTRANYIQAISRFLADWARAEGAVCPVEVVPNGVDLNKFKPTDSHGLSPQMTTDVLAAKNDKLLHEDITYKIRGCIFNVFNEIGFGQKESVYQKAIEMEFKKAGLKFESQKRLTIHYNGEKVGYYVPDFLVEDKVVIEIKSSKFLSKSNQEQTFYYLKGSNYKLALLINFGIPKLQIKRFVWFPPGEYRKNQRESVAENQRKSVVKIITTSRLVHKNGIDILIKSAAILRSKFQVSSFKFQIIGDGKDRNKLERLAKEEGVDDVVEFLGHIDPAKLPKYLAEADIFVRPSRSEGLGSSFLEAMAAGLPVIGTAVGGIPDFLTPYNVPSPLAGEGARGAGEGEATGLFVKIDDTQDLAEKIKLLIEDKQLRDKLSANGRELVERKYNWDTIAQQMNFIFQKL